MTVLLDIDIVSRLLFRWYSMSAAFQYYICAPFSVKCCSHRILRLA